MFDKIKKDDSLLVNQLVMNELKLHLPSDNSFKPFALFDRELVRLLNKSDISTELSSKVLKGIDNMLKAVSEWEFDGEDIIDHLKEVNLELWFDIKKTANGI